MKENDVLEGQIDMFGEMKKEEAKVEKEVKEEILVIGVITGNGSIDASGVDNIIKQEKNAIEELAIDEMEASEENLQLLKTTASDINKRIKTYDEARKSIEREWNKPLTEFLERAKHLNTYLNENRLKVMDKVKEVENKQIEEKKLEIIKYFNIKKESNVEVFNPPYDLGFIQFDDLNLNVIKSNSQVSYFRQIDEYFEKKEKDMKLIMENENSSLLLVKWKSNGYDLVEALTQITVEENKAKEVDAIKETVKHVEQVEIEISPKVEQVITVQFNLKGEKSKLKQVKEFALSIGVEIV